MKAFSFDIGFTEDAFEPFYEMLNIKSDAGIDEIKASFRKLAKIHHPDKNENSRDSQLKFQIIFNAYTTLSQPEKSHSG